MVTWSSIAHVQSLNEYMQKHCWQSFCHFSDWTTMKHTSGTTHTVPHKVFPHPIHPSSSPAWLLFDLHLHWQYSTEQESTTIVWELIWLKLIVRFRPRDGWSNETEALSSLQDLPGAAVQRSGKRGRSPLPQEPPYPPPKKLRMGPERAKARYAKLDDKLDDMQSEVRELRHATPSCPVWCKEIFQCGRSVSQLVQDLLDRKVSLSAPFLRLTVFENTDEKTNEPILRCIDNRRLFALKEYAKKSGKDRWWWTSASSARIHSRRSSDSYRTLTTPTDVIPGFVPFGALDLAFKSSARS